MTTMSMDASISLTSHDSTQPANSVWKKSIWSYGMLYPVYCILCKVWSPNPKSFLQSKPVTCQVNLFACLFPPCLGWVPAMRLLWVPQLPWQALLDELRYAKEPVQRTVQQVRNCIFLSEKVIIASVWFIVKISWFPMFTVSIFMVSAPWSRKLPKLSMPPNTQPSCQVKQAGTRLDRAGRPWKFAIYEHVAGASTLSNQKMHLYLVGIYTQPTY